MRQPADRIEEIDVTKPLTQTTGRRKEAVARARLRPGTGQHHHQRQRVRRLLSDGYGPHGRESSRSGSPATTRPTTSTRPARRWHRAARPARCAMAIARALVEIDEEMRPALKKAGLLTRDSRAKESKKYGLKKARKAPQYTKR